MKFKAGDAVTILGPKDRHIGMQGEVAEIKGGALTVQTFQADADGTTIYVLPEAQVVAEAEAVTMEFAQHRREEVAA